MKYCRKKEHLLQQYICGKRNRILFKGLLLIVISLFIQYNSFSQTGKYPSLQTQGISLPHARIMQVPNDDCNSAQVVTPDGSCTNGTTVGANDNWTGSVGCQSGGTHPDVWYSFTATGSRAQFTITTSSPWSGNVELVLVQGSCSGGFGLIGTNCGASPLNATFDGLVAGSTYYFTISNSNSSGTSGPFIVCLTTVSIPPAPGQDCSSAAILCNSTTFSQPTSNAGYGNQEVDPTNSCWLNGGERQSKWFKFTCGSTGTLEFNILQVNPNDDYDWAIWDISADPTNCSTKGHSIACNWSGCRSSTGLSSCPASEPGSTKAGAGCGGTYASWSTPITITAGHTYALLVDNYSATNSGFSLTFGGACGGGTAKIGPDATFTYAPQTCGSYSFTKTNATSNSTFLWQFGDGFSSTTQISSHTYSSAGTYIVSLEVTDALGCKATYSQTINVTSGVTPTFNAIGPLCQGSTAPALPTSSTNGIGGTWNPSVITTASTGTTTYTFTPSAGQCATTATMSISVTSSVTPTFSTFGPLCKGSTPPSLPTTSDNGINGTWSPSTISTANAGTSTYTFTPSAGQCGTSISMSITVNAPVTPTFTALGPYCQNATPGSLPTTSINGITGTWNPSSISTSTTGTATYTFTPSAGQCASTATMNITVSTSVIPIFTAIGPLCQGSTAPALPATSNNSITGSWNPSVISTASTGTVTYTFTPNAGQCATTATMNIAVTSSVTPTFNAIGPLCQGSTAPTLPATSTNGISGSWNPSVISTASTGTVTYTFTPNAGQCATTATMSISVTSSVTPTFTAIGPLCKGSTPPSLPTTSNNGINGTWSPSTISTATAGTSTYTFTPSAGQCGTSISMGITINAPVTPTFTALGPYCQNATPGSLPTTSINGITGTWNPSSISTSTTGTATYTFTPSAGQCATTATMNITVSTSVIPTFTAIGPLCQGSTAPALPATSNNSISGSWNPSVISTASTGTVTYTFTPNAGQCATTATMNIAVTSSLTPTFNAIGPLCQGSTAPTLPATSTNGISGTWNPSVITTASTGTTTYTFTPSAGQCATTATMSISVTSSVTPTFTAIDPLCKGSTPPALPTTSNNGINGTWSPSTISTVNAGTSTYTFTPSAGQCGTAISMGITVNAPVTPTFTALGPYCQNATPGSLPTTSINGITGTWNPSSISTSTTGTTTYTFTPSAGQCATTATMNITVSTSVIPTFTAIGPLCQGSTAPTLPSTSNNSITGSWNPSVISTASTGTVTYTFTPSAGQCATTATMNIDVTSSVTPTFNAIGPLCQGSTAPTLPATSTNGISGSWNPSVITTASTGTTTYTFTPSAGQCATTTTMNISVTSSVTPTFTAIGPLCKGSTPPSLPTTSNNGINGTWSPSTISTATAGTSTYTFTPSAGQCGTSISMGITINAPVTPTFTTLGPYCQNATPGSLPTASINGITGTWNPSSISTSTTGTTTYTFTPNAGQCATTATMNITVSTSVVPTFTAIGPLCQGSTAPALPVSSNNSITGSWNPSVISTASTGTVTYTFTPNAGQCATTATMNIAVTSSVTPTFNAIGPLCQGSTALTLPATSANGISGTWNPSVITTASTGTTTYTFTPSAGQCASIATMNFSVTAFIIPTFPPIGPLCQGSAAPPLPAISSNGISGNWTPSVISTTNSGSYAFTPSAGQCATSTTISITITALVTPTFSTIGPLCQNSAAPALPTTSNNNIAGTWSPSTINTSLVGTQSYSFTPSQGQCALPASIAITVINATALFSSIGPLCQNSSPPPLPTTSTNGIKGTWNPSTINTAITGSTTYTFSPSAGQCSSSPVKMDIVISSQVNPVFSVIGPLCINSIAPALPTTSNNGITGTWSPSTINTSTAGTFTYTFTPGPGQCASTSFSMAISINDPVLPTFNSIGPLCQGSAATPLSSTSLNGIVGNWNPSFINTSATTTYTFIPPAGVCAASTSQTIIINQQITPSFNLPGAICQGSSGPVLPATSTNGISGTWNPSSISSSTKGITTYTFTPNAGQCATTAVVSITVNAVITPAFTPPGPLCQNSTPPPLSSTSNDGITGTWSPSTISTATEGSFTYTFTPTPGQCASSYNTSISIVKQLTPVFNAIGPFCPGSTQSLLPSTSLNGIQGSWSPSLINTAVAGTFTYTFTPAAGQCASATQVAVNITQNPKADAPTDVQVCGSYILPPLNNGNYYSQPAGNGLLSAGTVITTSQTLYVFAGTSGSCFDEHKFSITITSNPKADSPPDITTCGSYILPQLNNGGYYNQQGGIGAIAVGTVINSSRTIYVYAGTSSTCFDEHKFTVTINNKPELPIVNVVNKCDGTSILSTSATGNLMWSTGSSSPSVIVSSGGTYTLTQSINGCSSDPAIVIASPHTNLPPPVITVTNSCSGTSQLTASNVLPAASVFWNTGATTTSISVSNPGSYSVTQSMDGCTSSPASVDISTTYTLSVTVNSPSICTGASATIFATVTPGGNYTYKWAVPAGVSDPGNVSNFTSTSAGNYSVTVTNVSGCTADGAGILNIGSNPVSADPKAVCSGEKVQLTAQPAGGTWSGSHVNGSVFDASNLSAGIYSVSYTYSGGTCSGTASSIVIVSVPAICSISGDDTTCPSSNVSYSAPPGMNSYAWTVTGNGIISGSTASQVVKAEANKACGDFVLNLTVTNVNGCSGSCAKIISVVDNEKPVCVAPQKLCITAGTNQVPPLQVTDNCSATVNVTYSITGATTRSGTGQDASGIFNPGTSLINWMAQDLCGNTSTCTTTVISGGSITPTFNQVGPLCQGSFSPLLPATSLNGFTGKWNPAVVNTASVGTTAYIFTPDDACVTTYTMMISVGNGITPVFNIASVCQGSSPPPLPAISSNGINGTWTPSLISTASAGTSTYTFTPASGCAIPVSVPIVCKSPVTPQFNSIGPLCKGSNAPSLSTISVEGINGIWIPASINTSITGTSAYVFTPVAGECANPDTLKVMVQPALTGTENKIICSGGFPFQWNDQSIIAGGSYSATLQSSSGCDSIAILILSVKQTLTGITNASICPDQLPYSWNGNKYASAGTYTMTLQSVGGCDSIAQLVLNVNPLKQSTTNINLCQAQLPYSWNNKSFNSAGTYSLTLQSATGCDSVVTLLLNVQSTSSIRYPAISTQPNVPVQLQARSFGSNSSYTWTPSVGLSNPAIANPVFNYDISMDYKVKITDPGGCSVVDSLLVKLSAQALSPPNAVEVFVPTAWSPNGDSHNDLLIPFLVNVKFMNYFRIYNRWGQKVFESRDSSQGWDGMFKGQKQMADTYSWIIEVVGNDDKTYVKTGRSILVK